MKLILPLNYPLLCNADTIDCADDVNLILILIKLSNKLEQSWVINWTMYILHVQWAHRLDLLAFEGKELMQPPWLSQPRKVKSSTQQVELFIELNNYYRKLHLNIIGNKVVIEKFFDHTGMVQTLLTPWNTSQPSREVKMTYLRLSSTASSVKMDS